MPTESHSRTSQFNRKVFRNSIAAIAVCCLALIGAAAGAVWAQTYTVTVDANAPKAPTNFMQGFLIGYGTDDVIDPTLVGTNLDPQFWRLGEWGRYDMLRAVPTMNPKVMMLLSDLLSIAWGGYGAIQPPPPGTQEYEAWKADLEAFAMDQARISLGLLAPPSGGGAMPRPVEYWEVWNEPEFSTSFYNGTWEQLLEIHQIVAAAIKSIDPEAKVIGPCWGVFPDSAKFNKTIFDFVGELAAAPYNTRLEAISWHNISWPNISALPSHMTVDAAAMRNFLTTFDPAYVAEIHITEAINKRRTQVPGWNVGFHYHAEVAELDFFNLSCWPMWSGEFPFITQWGSTCWTALNGRFMQDMVTVQQPYLVHWDYKKINDSPRIVATPSDDTKVAAIAADNHTEDRIEVLVGTFDGPAETSVQVDFTNFPYSTESASITVWKYANTNELDSSNNPKAKPATAQPGNVDSLIVFTGTVPVNGTTASYTINSFKDGEAYRIEAAAGGVLPTTTHVQDIVPDIYSTGIAQYGGEVTVTVHDDQGNPVANATVDGTFTGDFNESQSGVTNGSGVVVIQTNGTKFDLLNLIDYSFCMDNITHATLTYDSNDNVETCDSY